MFRCALLLLVMVFINSCVPDPYLEATNNSSNPTQFPPQFQPTLTLYVEQEIDVSTERSGVVLDNTATSVPVASSTPVATNPDIKSNVFGLFEFEMINIKEGWALGGPGPCVDTVLRTDDGGSSWKDITPSEKPEYSYYNCLNVRQYGAFFIDSNTGWALYGGEDYLVWKTTDGGQTWQPSSTLIQNKGYPEFIFVDKKSGWLWLGLWPLTSSQIATDLYRTLDGGETWEMLASTYENPILDACGKTGIAFADSQVGWITRSCPAATGSPLLVSQDGGATWDDLVLPPPSQYPNIFDFHDSYCGRFELYSPHLFTRDNGVVVMSCYAEYSEKKLDKYLYRTRDGGKTWTTSIAPGHRVTFLNDQSAWAIVESDIYHSPDGGLTWKLVNSVDWGTRGSIDFVTDEVSLALFYQPLNEIGELTSSEISIFRSDDGGVTWKNLYPKVH